MQIKHLFNWVKEIWDWLTEGKITFMGIGVVIIVLLSIMVTDHSEASIRIAGYMLQLAGMFFAVRGLLGVREHFKQPLLQNLFVDWFKRFPKFKKSIVIDASATMIGTSAMKARAEVWIPDKPELPIEERIQRIIRNLEQIRKQQSDNSVTIESLKDSLEEHKDEVTEERNKSEERIRSDSELLHTSDIITSLVGLVWLTVGISLSTLAPEICLWIK